MKKILYIGGFELPDKNAAAQRVMANALLLREMGFDVIFIGPTKDRSNAVSSVNGFKCEYVDYPTNTSNWLKYITNFIPINTILKHKPNYVVLYNFPSIASLKILNACHKHGIVVYHDLTEWESSKGWSPRQIIRKLDINLRMNYCIKKMDGVIAISKYLYDWYLPFTKCIMVPPTVDLSDDKWNRNRHLIFEKPIELVYAGTGGFGVKDKLDFIIENLSSFDAIHLTVIGMTKERYETGYGPLPKGCNNVTFRGRIPHIEAVKAVQSADFQMLIRDDTLKTRAGFPTKFVESISCGTPVIATLTSNIGDYIKDGYLGFVVDKNQSLRDVFTRLIRMDKSDIIKMKQQCRDFKGFDYHNYKNEFSKLFK